MAGNWQTQHLAAGSECPPLKPGVLRLYSMKLCPYAERTRLVLAAKNIPHEVVNINLKRKPDWYLSRLESGKVPALELDGKFVSESLITCDLLDELYPEPALYPADPWRKAQDRFWIERFSAVSSITYKIYGAGDDPKVVNELRDTFHKNLQPFEAELARRGTPFFHGERPGMLDLMIWPWMERAAAAHSLSANRLPQGTAVPPLAVHKHLAQWQSRMSQYPSVRECLVSTKDHMKFVQSYIAGTPDYDMKLGA